MELKHIKELMTAMGRHGTKKLSLKKEGFELILEREENSAQRGLDTFTDSNEDFSRGNDIHSRTSVVLSRGSDMAPHLAPSHAKEQEVPVSGTYITSPMVGTFYGSPSPDDPMFVKVGDKIEKNQVVCIIEAMKVMNEVKAGLSGTIAEVFIESGHPVEFGTKLFRII